MPQQHLLHWALTDIGWPPPRELIFLPKFAKDAGKLLKSLRNYVKKTKKEIAKELNVEEISELQDSINHVDKLMEEAPDKNLSDKK